MLSSDDPRHRNEICNTASISAYFSDYADRLRHALGTVDMAMLELARASIEETAARGARIHAIGNGGSAAIADHLCCDLVKGTHVDGHPTIEVGSLTSNVALYSAIANDFGFDEVFSRQIGFLAKPGDVLLAISSSGNSPNILAGAAAAAARGVTTIGLSGFSGGKLREIVDISLHVDASNYGIVEDAHQSIMHILAQFIACRRDGA